MENETIAMLISIFETSTLTLAIILAIACVVMLIMRKRFWNNLNTSGNDNAAPSKVNRIKQITQNAFIRALCIAALVAFLPELTYFNYQYYLRYFAGEEIATTTIDSQNPQLLHLTNGGAAELLLVSGRDGKMTDMKIKFNNLNEIVTSIHIERAQNLSLTVQWRDEEGTPYTFEKRLYTDLPHGYYIPLQPRGKVSELELSFSVGLETDLRLNQITLNKPIPFYFSGLRLLVLTFALFMIIIVANKETRTKLSYALFQYKFDAKNKKQTWAYVATVFLLLVLSWLNAHTGSNPGNLARPQHHQYNVYLVDALIAGRTWLDYGNPEKLLEWERPYDNHWRRETGKVLGVDWMWDWAWYNGKYYSYFGVVPAVILYVPYKLITGQYLSNNGGVFIFCAVAVIMLALLWRYCVIKWMPRVRFAFFILGFLTLYFTSHIQTLLLYARFYSIVQSAGLMFAITGIYLLLKSIDKEKVNCTLLFFACLSFALIAGCRPNMIFVSILVPILLWKRRSRKVFAFAALPYVIVAIPLMWYNYVRFDSITEFGLTYNLTAANTPTFALLNPVGRVLGTFESALQYLFRPLNYSLQFPYVERLVQQGHVSKGYHMMPPNNVGLINYPIVLFLLYMLKKTFRRETLQTTRPLLYGSLAAGFLTIIAISSTHWTIARYVSDFAFFIILPSLFCAYFFCHNQRNENFIAKTHMKIMYVLLSISITVGVLITITGGMDAGHRPSFRNPVLYYWLESVLSII